MNRHTPFFVLQEALGERGCAVCALTLQALERFFKGLVYESVNDISIRERIRLAYGFCAAHATLLREARSALGTAIIQRDVLRAASGELARTAPPGGAASALRSALLGRRAVDLPLAAQRPCPACELAAQTSREWADLLRKRYAELRPAFQLSSGLCLAHLRLTLADAAPAAFVALRDDQLAIWGQLEAELDEFIRKQDHAFVGEAAGAESDAWARAIDLLAGSWRVRGSKGDPGGKGP